MEDPGGGRREPRAARIHNPIPLASPAGAHDALASCSAEPGSPSSGGGGTGGSGLSSAATRLGGISSTRSCARPGSSREARASPSPSDPGSTFRALTRAHSGRGRKWRGMRPCLAACSRTKKGGDSGSPRTGMGPWPIRAARRDGSGMTHFSLLRDSKWKIRAGAAESHEPHVSTIPSHLRPRPERTTLWRRAAQSRGRLRGYGAGPDRGCARPAARADLHFQH